MAGLGRWLSDLLGGGTEKPPNQPPPSNKVTTGTWSRSMMMGTDVATLLIFHPDDMGHTEEWPLGWYAEGAIWRVESAAGRLVAWCTGGDGGWKLRLTDGDLTAAERAFAGPSWTFPLTSNGRVLIDNSDHLPADSEPGREPPSEAWIDLPEGDWHVTVTAVEWNAAPGADAANTENLPNYVVCFAPAEGPAPKIARRPPDLICLRDAQASDKEPDAVPVPVVPKWRLRRDQEVDFSQPMAAGLSENVGGTGARFSSQGESNLGQAVAEGGDSFAMFDVAFFMAPKIEPGAIGQVCRVNGAGGAPKKPRQYRLAALGPARIVEVQGVMEHGAVVETPPGDVPVPAGYQAPLASVTVEPIHVDLAPPDDPDPAALRVVVVDAMAPGGKLAEQFSASAAEYHRITLGDPSEPFGVDAFAIRCLPLTAAERLELATTDLGPRRQRLLTLLSEP